MATKPEDNSPAGNAARARIAESQRANRRRNRGNVDAADWANASPEQLKHVIENVTGSGAAIQFGYTRDGSSFVVRIVGDGEPFNEYVRPSEDISQYLEALAADYQK